MVEFPSLKLAKEIYHSQEYQEAYNIIASSSERDFVIVEGL